MTFKEYKNIIMEDRSRFSVDKTGRKVSVHFTSVFRFGKYLQTKNNIFARILLKFVARYYFYLRLITGIQLPMGTNVMGGLRFPHWSCIVIAQRSVIGKNCTIHQGVTIGQSHFGTHQGFPIIGNNVLIYAGAKNCGGIRVGDNVVIGANAVVNKDIPDNCVVAGVPAKIIKMKS